MRKLSPETMAEIKQNGWVLTGDGKIWLRGTGQTVTLAEARRRVRAWNKSTRYADTHNAGSDEPWQ